MRPINKITIPITTAADGTATVYGAGVYGLLYAVNIVKGTLADTADVTVEMAGGDFDNAILTITNLTAVNDGVYYPRANSCDGAGAVGTGLDCYHLLDGTIKVTVAQGGNAASGKIILTWIDQV